MQNVDQSEYKNRLKYVKGLLSVPPNINTLCKDNNLTVLDCLLDLMIKHNKFIINECQPILNNLTTKLKPKIQKFIILQCKINKPGTFDLLCSFFNNKNSKLVIQVILIIIEVLKEFEYEEVLLNNLHVIFAHPDSEVKKQGINLCVFLNNNVDVFQYLKDIKPILLKEIQNSITGTSQPVKEVKKEEIKEEVRKEVTRKEASKTEATRKETPKTETFYEDENFSDYFTSKYSFFKEKNWNTRLSEIKDNFNLLKNEESYKLANYLANSSETISTICIVFLELFPLNQLDKLLVFINKRITDLKLHPHIKSILKEIKDTTFMIDELYENAKNKKGKIFVSTFKLFHSLYPEIIKKEKLLTLIESSNISGLIEKNILKEIKRGLETEESNIDESILECEKSLSTLQIDEENNLSENNLTYKNVITNNVITNNVITDNVTETYKIENVTNKIMEDKEIIKNFDFQKYFTISKPRIKNGKEIEKYLKSEGIEYLKNEDLYKIPENILIQISDFILFFIKKRNLNLNFFLEKLIKQRYVASEFEIKTIIIQLIELNEYNLIVVLDKIYPVSKLQIILQRNIHLNYDLTIKVLNFWINKYKMFRGDAKGYYLILKNINDMNGIANLIKACPSLINEEGISSLNKRSSGLTPLSKKIQKDTLLEEMELPDFIEESNDESLILEENNLKNLEEEDKINNVCERIIGFVNKSEENNSFINKSFTDVKLLEEEFYSEQDNTALLQANTLINEILLNLNDQNLRILEKISKKKELILEINLETLERFILTTIELIIERKDLLKICAEILVNLCFNGKEEKVLKIYLKLIDSYEKIVLKLLKKFNDRITVLDVECLNILKEFYEKRPTLCIEHIGLHKVLRDLINKADINVNIDGLVDK